MSFLYLTADTIGTPTGGGVVTHHESRALKELGRCEVLSRTELEKMDSGEIPEPWCWDAKAHRYLFGTGYAQAASENISVTHIYAGTWPSVVRDLKNIGSKVVITIAAHDRIVSRREHEELGLPFPYPHLVEEHLWQQYIEGYRQADVVVCPSMVAAGTVRNYGPEFAVKRIEVIPHGTNAVWCPDCEGYGEQNYGGIPGVCSECDGGGLRKIKPLPSRFVVGYLGSYGPDKSVRYLLEAWKKLNYSDATLVLAGRDSVSPWTRHLIERFGGGNIRTMGWLDNVSDFYDQISLYVQPSATEGFGIEVLEAMAHGRPVITTKGCGANDLVWDTGAGISLDYGAGPDAMAQAIDVYHHRPDVADIDGSKARKEAENYTWDKIRAKYQELWRGLL